MTRMGEKEMRGHEEIQVLAKSLGLLTFLVSAILEGGVSGGG